VTNSVGTLNLEQNQRSRALPLFKFKVPGSRFAYTIVLDQPAPEVTGRVFGRALLERIADVDWTARELAVRPLSEFCSPEMFSAEDGLNSIRPLFREIAAWVVAPGEIDALLQDLRACESILSAAAQRGVMWHFQITMDDDLNG
jgi:hypothetical protein